MKFEVGDPAAVQITWPWRILRQVSVPLKRKRKPLENRGKP